MKRGAGSKRYQRWRTEALARARFACQRCGARAVPLEVHHVVPLEAGGPVWTENVEVLCRPCHGARHGFRPRVRDRAPDEDWEAMDAPASVGLLKTHA